MIIFVTIGRRRQQANRSNDILLNNQDSLGGGGSANEESDNSIQNSPSEEEEEGQVRDSDPEDKDDIYGDKEWIHGIQISDDLPLQWREIEGEDSKSASKIKGSNLTYNYS